MRRRWVIKAGVIGIAFPLSVLAQPRRVRIGILAPRPLSESVYSSYVVTRLEQLGYRQSTMILEYRSVDGDGRRYRALAEELSKLECDVLFALGTEAAARALRDVRSKTPVVFLAVNYDPVRAGLVKSLREPGGNITGVYMQHEAVAAKRLEIMQDVLPAARHFGVFADENTKEQLAALSATATKRGARLTIEQFDKLPYDLTRASDNLKRAGVDAVLVLGSPALSSREDDIGRSLAKHQLPAIGSTNMAEAGVLLAYYADNRKAAARSADMAARILKGAKPADMPVEQADEFDLVLNLRTAKALGIKIPQSFLARVTRVIE